MSPMKPHRVSYVEDTNEDTGSIIAGTERYAVSEAPSPIKERPNTGKSRRERSISRSASSSPVNGLTDSDSTVHPTSSLRRDREAKMRSREERERERDRDRRDRDRDLDRARSSKQPIMRPPNKSYKTTPPVLHTHSHSQDAYRNPPATGDDSSYYGVSPSSAPRPRAFTSRPNASYYGPGSRPPPSNPQWYPHQNSSSYVPTSYPPPSYGPSHGPPYQPPQSPSQGPDYFGPSAMSGPQHQHLAQRFQRPSSAMGVRTTSSHGFDDYEKENDKSLMRRPSLTKKHRDDDDRRRMPPPPRPVSAAPRHASIRGPPPHLPPSQPRRAIDYGFDDGDFDGDDSRYRDIPSRSASYSYGYGEGAVLPRSRRDSVSYDGPAYRIEPATNTNRRHSYYGGSGKSTDSLEYEDKFRAAAAYQEDMTGSGGVPLTAETLRKAGKRSSDKSSRSTRSSESRDESDYRQSNTTRTTRSSAGDEDITIRVTGSATLKLGGAEIQCQDGGEINITQPANNRVGGSSDKDSVYSEDRRSRIEHLPIRARASSQATSWNRSPVSYDPYDSYGGGRPPFF